MGMQQVSRTIGNVLASVFGAAAALIIVLLMFLTFTDVVGRNLLNRPIAGASELTELGLFLIIFLMLPQVTIRHQHIIVNLLDSWMRPIASSLQKILAALLGMVMFAVIGWELWSMAARANLQHEVLPTLGWPLAPFLYLMAITSAVHAVAFVCSLAVPLSEADSISLA
jgi:TRAP-type C4-dicarboxylate transport system permease small subunit